MRIETPPTFGVVLCFLVILIPVFTHAQIVRDSSLGAMKNQPLTGPNYAITPDLGVIQGPNLFQSFSQFNVNTLQNGTIESATFSGPNGINNVVTRVTGNSFSTINGWVQSTIPGASLYFLNPRGVLFGPNASINVGGSFYVSTADFVRFTDGTRFFTNLNQVSTLSSAPIVSFGFLGPTVSPVVVQGADLRVSNGQRLGIIAGDQQIVAGALRAPSGRVELAAVASAGEVIPAGTPDMPRLILQGFTSYGTMTLLNSLVETTRSGGGGGTVLIRGGRVIVDGSGIFSHTLGDTNGAPLAVSIQIINDLVVRNNSQIASQVTGAGDGGTINTFADTVEVNTGSALATGAFGGSGKPGDINMLATRILIAGGGVVGSTVSSGSSQGAGAVTVTATESITIAGELSQLSSSVSGAGVAGQVSVSAPLVELKDGGSIQTFVFGTGKGGGVDIQGRQVRITDGGQIVTNSLGGIGGGPVTITAEESITITGQRASGAGTSSSLISTSTAGLQGDAGAIILSAPSVELSNTGGLQSLTSGQGNAGTITINTAQLTVSGGAQLKNSTTESSSGRGGTINVAATERVTITGKNPVSGPTGFFSDTSGSGNGGNISIAAPAITVEDGAVISSSSTANATGAAGSITLQGLGGPGSVANTLTLQDSSLLTKADGNGAGGSIDLHATSIGLQNATISAATVGTGKAGSITLADMTTFTGTNSAVTTEATSGQGGTILLNAPAANTFALTNTTVSATVKGGNQRGGDIRMMAPNIGLTGGAVTAETQGTGAGGDITLSAGPGLALTGNANVSTRSSGAGDAGNILLSSTNTLLIQDSTVTAQASQASGGNITLQAPYLVQLINSTVSSSVQGGVQTVGGNIIVDPQFVILQNSKIIAQAFQGQGGNITINSGVFLADPSSVIDASSQLGVSGTVTINSPIQSLSGTLAPLNQAYLAAAGLLRERCAVRAQTSSISSFVVRGRDGLPATPGNVLPSPPAPLPPAGGTPTLRRPDTRDSIVDGTTSGDVKAVRLADGNFGGCGVN